MYSFDFYFFRDIIYITVFIEFTYTLMIAISPHFLKAWNLLWINLKKAAEILFQWLLIRNIMVLLTNQVLLKLIETN